MVRITIRDLHTNTAAWVRKAAEGVNVVITDRSRPIAKLVSIVPQAQGRTFAARRIVEVFLELPLSSDDSTVYLSEDRDRA